MGFTRAELANELNMRNDQSHNIFGKERSNSSINILIENTISSY